MAKNGIQAIKVMTRTFAKKTGVKALVLMMLPRNINEKKYTINVPISQMTITIWQRLTYNRNRKM